MIKTAGKYRLGGSVIQPLLISCRVSSVLDRAGGFYFNPPPINVLDVLHWNAAVTGDPDTASQKVTSGSQEMVILYLSATLLYDEVKSKHSVKDACKDLFNVLCVHDMGHMLFSGGIRSVCHK